MNILVTGGAGYIGSHTCKKLFKAGYTPVVLDDLSTGHESLVKWGPFEKGDIKDYYNNLRIIKKYNIEAIIHFAAKAYVGESILDPEKYFNNNIIGTLKLLQAMLDANINVIINSSTCAVYGIPDKVPIPESHNKFPVNPYGDSKLFIEKTINWYAQAYGLKYVNLRYFNAAGADIEAEIGESHYPETHLIPRILQVAFGQKSTLKIFGSDYKTSDGTAIRDYIHVDDLAKAHVKALDYITDKNENVSMNLGSGVGSSIFEIIERVENITGKHINYKLSPRRQGDPPVLIADTTLASEIIDWEKNCHDINKIIESAWIWHSKFAKKEILRKNDKE